MNSPHAPLHDPLDADGAGEPRDPRHERLCALLLGELDAAERRAVESELQRDPELREEHERLAATIGLIRRAIPEPELSPAVQETLRRAAERRGAGAAAQPTSWSWRLLRGGSDGARLAAAALVVVGGGLAVRAWLDETGARTGGHVARNEISPAEERQLESAEELRALGYAAGDDRASGIAAEGAEKSIDLGLIARVEENKEQDASGVMLGEQLRALDQAKAAAAEAAVEGGSEPGISAVELDGYRGAGDTVPPQDSATPQGAGLGQGSGVSSRRAGGIVGAGKGGRAGRSGLRDQGEKPEAYFFERFGVPEESAPTSSPASPGPSKAASAITGRSGEAQVVQDELAQLAPPRRELAGAAAAAAEAPALSSGELDALRGLGYVGDDEAARLTRDKIEALEKLGYVGRDDGYSDEDKDDEDLHLDFPGTPESQREAVEVRARSAVDRLVLGSRVAEGERPVDMFRRYFGDHPFVATELEQLSTFAADVDTASYGLARRTLRAGRLPPAVEVRTEEFVNAFRPDIPAPVRETFALGLELAPSRFGPDRDTWMLRAVVRGREVDALERQPVALTFVIDVSGSMDEPDRLPLVSAALRLLLAELDAADSVALVAFRREATVVSPMVSAANQRGDLEDALAALDARGGTNVEAGLLAGFELAARALTPHAVNRVVLLSDGVGNVGETDQTRILAKVAELRATGLYLNTVGVGLGDHHDAFLEQLADRGDGLCEYIDSEESARRALVENFTGAFQPIARDVKLQLEFDPGAVEAFRQLGYENRALAHADFKKDEVDAGEVNAGHQVTALYELRLRPGVSSRAPLATLRVRYKPPFAVDRGETAARARAEAETAQEIHATLTLAEAATAFDGMPLGYRRAVLVAQLAEHLRRSIHAHDDSFDELRDEARRLAPQLRDPDFDEFLELLELAGPLLAAERAGEAPELHALTRELGELRYRQAHRELVHGEIDADELAAENLRIAELEELVRQSVRTRYGLEPAPVPAEKAAGER